MQFDVPGKWNSPHSIQTAANQGSSGENTLCGSVAGMFDTQSSPLVLVTWSLVTLLTGHCQLTLTFTYGHLVPQTDPLSLYKVASLPQCHCLVSVLCQLNFPLYRLTSAHFHIGDLYSSSSSLQSPILVVSSVCDYFHRAINWEQGSRPQGAFSHSTLLI